MASEVITEVKENMRRTTCGLSRSSLRTHPLYLQALQNQSHGHNLTARKAEVSPQEGDGEILGLKVASHQTYAVWFPADRHW